LRRRKKGEGRRWAENVPLIKPRDPHLAGGAATKQSKIHVELTLLILWVKRDTKPRCTIVLDCCRILIEQGIH